MPVRIKHLGIIPTTTPALISLAELPETPTTPTLPVLVKTYLRSDVAKHDLSHNVYCERTALVRLSNDRSGLVARLLSANVTPTCLTFTMARASGIPAVSLPRPLPPVRVSQIATQLISALRRVHAQNIVHADVTLRNVIVDPSREDALTLVDFSACFIRGHPPKDASRTTSAHVLAPELLDGGTPDPAADIWAVGVFIWALLFGGPGPFAAETDAAVLRTIQKAVDGNFDVTTQFRLACARVGKPCVGRMKHAMDFLAICLSPNPSRRFSSRKRESRIHKSWVEVIDYDRIYAHEFLRSM